MQVVFLVIAVFCFFTGTSVEAQPPLTLEECYELALQRSEALAIDETAVQAADARYRQAVSTVFPELTFGASEVIREETTSGTREFRRTSGGSRFETAFQVTQPIFNGFREWFEARAAAREIEAARQDQERTKQLLFGNVARLFLQSLLYADDIDEAEAIIKVLLSRSEELKRRRELGRSRESELLEAQSDIVSTRALIEQLRGLERASQEALAFFIGLPAEEFTLAPPPPLSILPDLTEALAGIHRPDITAADRRIASQQALVRARERERWPSVSLQGNVYPYESPSSDDNWDVSIRVSVPIFEGGRIAARVAEERALLERNRLVKQELIRRQEEEVRRFYAEANAADKEAAVLAELVQVAERTLKAQREDYELGVVTNLQVMEAIRQVQDAKRRLLNARFTSRLKRVELAVALGKTAL